MSDSIFGAALIDSEVGTAVESWLTTWFPTYLGFVTRGLATAGIDIGPLPPPNSYIISSDPNHYAEEQLPAVVIAVPGTTGRPQRDAVNYRAFFDVRVVVFVSAPDRPSTEALAKYYSTAVRMIMVNKPDLGNFAEGVAWLGTSYGIELTAAGQRTRGSAANRFAVDVRDVVQAFAGPTDPVVPPSDAPADWPLATDVKATLTPVALDALDS